jgi:hypothetical protein
MLLFQPTVVIGVVCLPALTFTGLTDGRGLARLTGARLVAGFCFVMLVLWVDASCLHATRNAAVCLVFCNSIVLG